MRAGKASIEAIEKKSFNLRDQFVQSLVPSKPWDSIVDFATHRSFCGLKLYPRQQTMLKLIYLETEIMTDFDVSVIEEWRAAFRNSKYPTGVQPDIWERVKYLKDNGYSHFPMIIPVMGRRAGKGHIGGVLGCERASHMVSLNNPQEHYGIESGKQMFMTVMATNFVQAKKHLFADIRHVVESNQWLNQRLATNKDHEISIRTDADLREIAKLRSRKIPVDREIASVRGLPASTSSSSSRGGANFFHGYDEFAFMLATGGSRSSEEVFAANQPSLDQFGKDGMTYTPSSPFSKIGKLYDLYKSGSILMDEYLAKVGELASAGELMAMAERDTEDEERIMADPEMVIFQLESWEPYKSWERGKELVGVRFRRPIQYEPSEDSPEGLRMLRLERRDPEKFKVERRAQFAEVQNAYLDPDVVDNLFTGWKGEPLRQKESGSLQWDFRAHMDPSRVNANFSLAIAHLEPADEPDEWGNVWNHVIFDKTHVWQPKDFPNHTVDYVQILEELKQILANFRALKHLTSDDWNSASTIDHLRQWAHKNNHQVKVDVEHFTDKRNKEVAEMFKSAANLGWVHIPTDNYFNDGEGCLAEMELKFLSLQKGKVEKQATGPVQTKDLADSLMAVSVRLLEGQLNEHLRTRLGEQRPQFGAQSVRRDPLEGLHPDRVKRASEPNLVPDRARSAREGMDNFRNRGRRHPFSGR